MSNNKSTKQYWGIGLENETYLQFEDFLIVPGDFICEKIGRERYSLDYTKYYKPETLQYMLNSAFDKNKNYFISRMLNSHSLEKLDSNFNHKTLPKKISVESPDNGQISTETLENPAYSGKSNLEAFLEKQTYDIYSMVTTKTNPFGAICFDGDSIEFVTKYFENRTINESCNELIATKNLFVEKLNESRVFKENISFPKYNSGLNMFMSNQENIVMFNNGTYHFHITLPTITENSRIVDYEKFDAVHANAIYLLQWFEPLFIATLGSPDIMGVISKKYDLNKNFALGSMRNAMSRYIGVGTYHKSMARGKILTYKVEDFRKLLKFTKEENIWWRDQVENNMEYVLLEDVGLDFNQEKMYQSGFEMRSFDEFPISYLNNVLYALILICEHSLHIENIMWSHDSKVWNNLIFKSLKNGYQTIISYEEKLEILQLLQLISSDDNTNCNLSAEWENIELLDEFFFKVLDILHQKYQQNAICIEAFCGKDHNLSPIWDNFNRFQIEQHQLQIEHFEKVIA